MNRNKIYLTLFFSLLLLKAGCKPSETANNNAIRNIDYAQYETYNYGDAIIVSSENPSFSWPQFNERVKREIDFLMEGKGLQKSLEQPDLQIYFYAIVDSSQNRPLLPYQIGWAAEPFIKGGELFDHYPDNTLMIDFVDANTSQLVWRSSIELPYYDQEKLYKVLPKRMYSLIQKYPQVY